MDNLSWVIRGKIACHPYTSKRPQLGENIVVDQSAILHLAVERGYETEFCFRAAICLDDRAVSVACFGHTRVWCVPGSCRILLGILRLQGPSLASSAAILCTGETKENFRRSIERAKSQRSDVSRGIEVGPRVDRGAGTAEHEKKLGTYGLGVSLPGVNPWWWRVGVWMEEKQDTLLAMKRSEMWCMNYDGWRSQICRGWTPGGWAWGAMIW